MPAQAVGEKQSGAQRSDDPAVALMASDLPAGLIEAADALRDRGRHAEAAQAYRAALELLPGRSDLRVQLGNMLKDSGALPEAEAAYRLALSQEELADTHVQLGHVLKLRGDRAAAVAQYRRAAGIDPSHPGAIDELARAGEAPAPMEEFDPVQRGAGVEALLTLSHGIAAMRAELDRLGAQLPDALARTAFPVAFYDQFRSAFPVPPPFAGADRAAPLPFHVVLLAERETLATLFGQLGALQAQSTAEWTLSVIGHDPDRRRVVALAALADPRIRWVEAMPDAALGAQERAAVAPEGWSLLLAAHAMLDQHALAWFARAAAWCGAAAFVCDEEAGRQERGRIIRASPVLRQVVDADTLRETNVFGETVAVRGAAYHAAALPDGDIAGMRRQLLLRLAATGQVGHVPHPLVWRSEAEPLAAPMAIAPAAAAPIAVIIATRDNAADLRGMLDSLRAKAQAAGALEFLVIDNGSQADESRETLRQIGLEGGARIITQNEPFNWSRLMNRAVGETRASLLLFANDDMRMLTQGWDGQLRALLARPGVGAVGARLLYEDDRLQHGGIILGWNGTDIHDGLGEPKASPGPAARWQVTRAVGAVTGAFLATSREDFGLRGGFDAQGLPVAYSDIDYCLKLRAAGLRVLWTPSITLYHHESKTRGLDRADPWRAARNAHERAVMQQRWGAALDIDPGVHPAWHGASMPFRLLAAPSMARVRAHVRRTGSGNPWLPPPAEGEG